MPIDTPLRLWEGNTMASLVASQERSLDDCHLSPPSPVTTRTLICCQNVATVFCSAQSQALRFPEWQLTHPIETPAWRTSGCGGSLDSRSTPWLFPGIHENTSTWMITLLELVKCHAFGVGNLFDPLSPDVTSSLSWSSSTCEI